MSENSIRRYSLEEILRMKGQTDFEKLRAQGDYEGPQEFDVDWSKARLVIPEPKTPVSIRLDPEVLEKRVRALDEALNEAEAEAKQHKQRVASLEAQLEDESRTIARQALSAEAAEGINAFLAKRKPLFPR